jgi:hypothetical protein
MAFVIANGAGDRWRFWRNDPVEVQPGMWNSGPDWTDDINKALHFSRRSDAESFCEDDEDAWFIQPRAIVEEDQAAADLDMARRANAARELCLRAQRVIQAPADVFTVGDIMPLLTEMAGFINFFAPVRVKPRKIEVEAEKSSEPSEVETPHCKLVDKLSPAEVLLLFRAFVTLNATQWKLGAGDHHHPMWEHVAVNVEGIEPTSGPKWEYIQPRNRLPLVELEFAALVESNG